MLNEHVNRDPKGSGAAAKESIMEFVPLYVPLTLVGQSSLVASANGKRISYRDYLLPEVVTTAVGVGCSGRSYSVPVGQKPYVAVEQRGAGTWAGRCVTYFPVDTRARVAR